MGLSCFLLVAVTAAVGVFGEEVCYTGLGCFNNKHPYKNSKLPWSPEDIKLHMLLYTRSNKKSPDKITHDDAKALKSSHFDAKLPVKVIIHGFQSAPTTGTFQTMKDNFLEKGAFNIFMVDWSAGAGTFIYTQAASNIRVVAAGVTALLQMMIKAGVSWGNVHLIGHSLGAQTCGLIGLRTKGMVGRISGLDPAKPGFEGYGNDVKLDKSDAKFVDVIHSNTVSFIALSGYGTRDISGHVDFFPNGGEIQAGCITDRRRRRRRSFAACSHSRATELYAASIKGGDCKFIAFPCAKYEDFQKGKCMSCGSGGCGEMGFGADKAKGRGVLYLDTLDKYPFCGHHYVVDLTPDAKSNEAYGVLSMSAKSAKYSSNSVKIIKSKEEIKPSVHITAMVVFARKIDDATTLSVEFSNKGWLTSNSFAVSAVKVTSAPVNKSFKTCPGTQTLKSSTPKSMSTSNGRC